MVSKGGLGGVAKLANSYHILDARPNYARYSSDNRMVRSVSAGMRHIRNFVHPQVVLLDDTEQEDSLFVKTLQKKTQDLQIPVIGLPQDALQNMMWITRLDSGSLQGMLL